MKLKSNNTIQPKDYELLNLLYKFKYLDFSFIDKYIITGYSSRYELTRKLNTLVSKGLINKFMYVKHQEKILDPIVYSLTKKGFDIVSDKYSSNIFDEDGSTTLRQGYEHHLIVAHLLYNYTKIDKESKIFGERESYYRYLRDDEKRYRVIRPDGSYITKEGFLFILEFEHSNDRRNLSKKFLRYNDYVPHKRYLKNDSYDECYDDIVQAFVILITNNPIGNKVVERLKSLKTEYILLTTTVEELLENPRGDIFEDVNQINRRSE